MRLPVRFPVHLSRITERERMMLSMLRRLPRRLLFPLLLALAPLPYAQAQAQETLATPAAPTAAGPSASALPASLFFAPRSLGGATLSPDGRFLAMRVLPAGERQRVRLSVLDLASMQATVVAYFNDADIANFQWVNNDRLAYSLVDRQRGQGRQRFASGMFAVNKDGSGYRQLATREGIVRDKPGMLLQPWSTFLIDHISAQTGNFVYVWRTHLSRLNSITDTSTGRLNTLTGGYETVNMPPDLLYWMSDSGVAWRMDKEFAEKRNMAYTFDRPAGTWRKLAQVIPADANGVAIAPAFLAPDGQLYVYARNGGDKLALYRFDQQNQRLDGAPVLASPDYDIQATMVHNDARLLGIRYRTDAETTLWLDADMQAMQLAVNARLPATVNTLSVAQRTDAPWVLVSSWSDVQPPIYRLFERASGKLIPLGKAYPAVAAERMASRQLLHIKARDGLTLPAWLTLPKGNGRQLPLVVLIHDGPWQRGDWGWQPDSQFLASRGYAVLEPDYRGSTGLGARHFQAGWKQWGLAMQDDIADAARWAIGEGIADPQRICLAGGGYGGYATLMGLQRDAGLFRCGIAWSSIPDLRELKDEVNWWLDDDLRNSDEQYTLAMLLGDADKDKALLRDNSPRHQPARITAPLLMAHGYTDHIVPMSDARALFDAIRKSSAQAQWIEYGDEGHDWVLPQTHADFWQQSEKFLDKHIGKASAAAKKE